ncbi:MAG: RNA polymerase sigma factor [Thermoleophilia bacterium]|nr:RNA polymerase sigma factor [Thermoleophilia bacterium]
MDGASIHARKTPGGLRLRLLSDRSLATQVVAGDRVAFEELFRRYRQPLYGFCLSILGSEEDSADALQNTMAKALKTLPGEERELLLKPWLFRVARNECIDLIRSRKPADDITEKDPPASQGLEAEFAGRERLRELLSDLEHLPEKQRSALVMRELNGLSFDEIGDAFATSPSAAKQVVYEARVALQDAAKGRDMECEPVLAAISEQDGRVLRGRLVRAHLRSCSSCRDFKRGIETRGKDFKALIPPIPAAVVAAVIGMINGSGGGGAGFAGLVGLKAALGGSAAKTVAVVAVTATVGAGAVGVVESNRHSDNGGQPSQSPVPAAVTAPGSGADGSMPVSEVLNQWRNEVGGTAAGKDRPDGRSDAGQGGGASAGGDQGSGGGSLPADSGEDAPGNSGNTPGGSGGSKGLGAVPSHGGKPSQLPEAAAQGQQKASEAQSQAGPPATAGKSTVTPAAGNGRVTPANEKNSK